MMPVLTSGGMRRASILRHKAAHRKLSSLPRHGRNKLAVDEERRQSILFLASASWPDPNATAAGTRTNSLLRLFTSSDIFTSVHFGCGAKLPTHYGKTSIIDQEKLQVHWHRVKLNKYDEMKRILDKIELNHGPIKAVIFDRFYTEEAFSFIVQEVCPHALRVLDMQDVHSLRIGRQGKVEAFDKNTANPVDDTSGAKKLSSSIVNEVMKFDPKENYQRDLHVIEDKTRRQAYDIFLRELASIHRSDLVLVCSSAEMKLLESWNVGNWKLVHAPFFCDDLSASEERLPSFHQRSDFVTVGG